MEDFCFSCPRISHKLSAKIYVNNESECHDELTFTLIRCPPPSPHFGSSVFPYITAGKIATVILYICSKQHSIDSCLAFIGICTDFEEDLEMDRKF